MIRTALEFIKKELNAYIAARENDPANYGLETNVDLKSIVTLNGGANVDDDKHINVMLVGIEEERREGKRPYIMPADKNNFITLNPPVEINLFLLFVAPNSNYETALRDVSDVIAFFQSNPVFDEAKFPNLNNSVKTPALKPWQLIDRLSFRLYNLSFEQQNNLWAMFGGKYLPSVVYKATLLTVFDTKSRDVLKPITQIGVLEN